MRITGVVSYKGGVGTSTASLGIAKGLSALGKKVCLIDMKCRGNLDIMTGLQDSSLFGLDDFLSGRELSDCVVKNGQFDFCASSHNENADPSADWEKLKSCADYDIAIVDSPPASFVCDTIISVCNCDFSSVRDAEELSGAYRKASSELFLVINRFGEFEKAISPIEIIDITHTQLLGIVPYVPFLQSGGESSESKNAFMNISKRLTGASVPIFENSAKRTALKKMLGTK